MNKIKFKDISGIFTLIEKVIDDECRIIKIRYKSESRLVWTKSCNPDQIPIEFEDVIE